MAKSAGPSATFKATAKRKRKGVHSKTRTSSSKNSKHYKKLNVGQG